MLDLKNCPFCDASDNDDNACQEAGVICTEVPTAVGARGWQVVCRCGASSPKQLTAAEAVAAWNRRALQAVGPEPAVAVKPLVEQIDALLALENPVPAIPHLALSLLASARSALVATPPAEPVVEEWREIEQHVQPRLADGYTAVAISKPGFWMVKGPGPAAALAAKPAVKDDETVVEALPNWTGWRSIDTAPEDCRVLLATAGNWVGEAIMLRDEETGEQVWTWVDTGKPSLHSCYGWMPLPEHLLAPVLSDLRPDGFDGPTGAE